MHCLLTNERNFSVVIGKHPKRICIVVEEPKFLPANHRLPKHKQRYRTGRVTGNDHGFCLHRWGTCGGQT
jgi:hypothetical protein